MDILILLILLVAATVLPVMFAARAFGAENTGFGHALLAVLLHAGAMEGISRLGQTPAITAVAGTLLGGFFFAAVLGTNYGKGLLISIVALLLRFAIIVVGFALLGISP